jgi:hypothetical protein
VVPAAAGIEEFQIRNPRLEIRNKFKFMEMEKRLKYGQRWAKGGVWFLSFTTLEL